MVDSATSSLISVGARRRIGWDESLRGDEQDTHWYEVEPGYVNEENCETMFARARLPDRPMVRQRPVLPGGDLQDPSEQRILEFALEDLWDDEAKGELLPLAVSLPDGAMVIASWVGRWRLVGGHHCCKVRMENRA